MQEASGLSPETFNKTAESAKTSSEVRAVAGACMPACFEQFCIVRSQNNGTHMLLSRYMCLHRLIHAVGLVTKLAFELFDCKSSRELSSEAMHRLLFHRTS